MDKLVKKEEFNTINKVLFTIIALSTLGKAFSLAKEIVEAVRS